MNNEIFIFVCMLFCHIVDDYYLQGWLASAKQKEWWQKNAPDLLYKNDYQMALMMHSISWSFSIMIPLAVIGKWNIGLFLINMFIHYQIDDLKANLKKINLIQDQTIHVFQILITFILTMFIL